MQPQLTRCLGLMLALIPSLGLAADSDKAPVPVTLVPLKQIWFQPEYSAPATVVPLNKPKLAAEINARVLAISVQVGEAVEPGQVLVTLDCRDLESRLDQQQAQLRLLQSQQQQAINRLKRAQNLRLQHNLSDDEFEARETERDGLEAQVRAQQEVIGQRERDVARCTITAPFQGEVQARLVSIGEMASPGSALIELVQLDKTEVEAMVRPELVADIEQASLQFDYLDKGYPLTLARISAVVDSERRTQRLRLGFRAETAPSGAAGRLVWKHPKPHLPAEYLQRRGQQMGVFYLDKGHARFQPIDQAIEGRPAPITLPAETPIIDQGRHGLKDGDPVQTPG